MPVPVTNTAIIILAAGSSSRLGQPKQLLQFRGKPLLQRMIDIALAANSGPVLVVLGAQAEQLAPLCNGAEIIRNDSWQEGLASSIRQAIAFLETRYPQAAGCILTVCDQPMLSTALLVQLTETHAATGKSIVAAAYDDITLGTPAYFHQNLFHELLALSGDKGAKPALQKDAARVATVPFPGGKMDIDTATDYEQLLQQPTT